MSSDTPSPLDTSLTIAPPVLTPVAPTGPWGAWPTIGFGAIGMAINIAVPVVHLLVMAVVRAIQGAQFNPMTLALSGDFTAISTFCTAPLVIGACFLFARMRRPFDVQDYLGIRRFRFRDILLGMAILAVYLISTSLLEQWVGQPPNSIMMGIFRSANHPVLLILAIAVAAPLSEEFLFRGLMPPGLSQTRLKWFGAALISTAAWTLLHVQYHGLEIAELFTFGIILGWLRHHSGSIWVPVLVHGVNNLAATAMMAADARP